MRTYIAAIPVLACLTLTPFGAQAGFEFMPQKMQAKPAPAPALPMQVAPPMMPNVVPAVPMAPVMREPLMPAPTNLNPAMMAPTMPAPVAAAPFRPTGLVINPYPMQPGYQKSAMANVASGSVNRALVEQAGLVMPMPLGPNMQTGAQVEMATRPTQKPQRQAAYTGYSNLTPIPGGSPAPIARAPLGQRNNYAEAVGFGKDIPLSIALMQVIPEAFKAQLPSSELENAIVSWDGGKPWNQVLNDMLRPLGYSASIQGSTVSIGPYLRG